MICKFYVIDHYHMVVNDIDRSHRLIFKNAVLRNNFGFLEK